MKELEEFAVDVAREGGDLIRQRWDKPRHVSHKSAIDLVTDCDRAVEEHIVARIARSFPDHAIMAEESSTQPLPERGYCWVIDPLDGTTNWVHSCPHVAVSVAVACDGEVCTGAVYDPLRGELFHGRRGGGSWSNGQRIGISRTAHLRDALLATGFAPDCRERSEFYVGFLQEFMKVSRGLRRFGAAALDLCYVACGRFDGYWEAGLGPWDMAAGSLIVAEAGGRMTDYHGAPHSIIGEQTLASNGLIHAEMVEVLQRRLAAMSIDGL